MRFLQVAFLCITIFILNFSFSSCNKDTQMVEPTIVECPDTLDYGVFKLQETSFDVFPFYDEFNTIIFSDQNGEEYEANNFGYQNQYGTFTSSYSYLCESDPDHTYPYIYQRESALHIYQISELNLSITFYLEVFVGRKFSYTVINNQLVSHPDSLIQYVNDVLKVRVESFNNTNENAVTRIVLNTKEVGEISSEITTPIESVSINGHSFSTVFTNAEEEDDKYDLVYNKTLGLVGIIKRDGSLSMNFERFEN